MPDVVNRIVAFVDILGFKGLVNEAFGGDRHLLKWLNETLEGVANLSAVTNMGALGVSQLSPYLRATAFSDSIVISDRFDGVDGRGLHCVVQTAARLAADLLCRGILCRGAFATGEAVHNDRVLFGKGINAAYELEREAAVFPRLVFADDLVSKAQMLTFGRVKQDSDGTWYLDVFWQFNNLHQPAADVLPAGPTMQGPMVEAFRPIRRAIVENLAKDLRPSIVAKYRWLAMRFNDAVTDYIPGEIELVEIDSAGSKQ